MKENSDYIVGVYEGYHAEDVLKDLDSKPDNLRIFEVIGNMFAATLTRRQVLQLLEHKYVEYVECDGVVSIAGK